MLERLIPYVLLVNAIISALYFLLCVLHVSRQPAYMALLPLLLPVAGALAVLITDVLYAHRLDGKRGVNAERFIIEDRIYGRVESPEDLDVIPLGDALIIDDHETRRAIMMEILHKDPEQFAQQLKRVLDVDDTEMIHYSATTIVEMRALFDDELMRLENACRTDDANLETVLAYARSIGRYLDSGILEGMRKSEIACRYSNVLRRAIRLAPSTLEWRLRYVENERRGKRYANAWEQLQRMMQRWPADERVWLSALHYAIAAKDAQLVGRLCKDAKKRSGGWPIAVRKTFAFWMEPVVDNEA